MGNFIHAKDDNITIIDDLGNSSVYPLSWWITQEPTYELPDGASAQHYRQSEEHAYVDADGGAIFLEIPWADGDTYIANKATYDAAWLPASMNLAQAKIYQISLMQQYAEAIRADGVTYSGITYKSAASYYNRWKNEHDYALRNSALLTSHYLKDISGNEIVMPSVAALTGIIDDTDEFYWLIQQQIDNHEDAINAIDTTVADVLAYDYTTGWPITPYDTGLTFYASCASSINADYAGGTATGTATGGAAISGGYLDLAHDDARYVSYDGTSNVDNQQVGSILIEALKPNYPGTPASDQVIFSIAKADADSTNLIQLTHKATTGNLQLDIKDSSDVSIASITFGAWSPASGTDYKLSVHYDITAGNTWLKIDDTQLGTADTSTGTRDANIGLLRIGSGYNSGAAETSNFKIKLVHISNQ